MTDEVLAGLLGWTSRLGFLAGLGWILLYTESRCLITLNHWNEWIE